MALVDIGGTFEFPPIPFGAAGTIALSTGTFTLDAASEKAAAVFEASRACSIRKIHFRTGTVTTGATLDCRVETVSAVNGDPSGTLFAVNTNVSHVLNNTDDNVWLSTANLTADATLAQGDRFALVIVNPAVSAGNFILAHASDALVGSWGYGDLFTASWAKQTNYPMIIAECSDGSFLTPLLPGFYPASAVGSTTFNNTSTPDERGVVITPQFDCRTSGGWLWISVAAGIGWDVVLYAADGTTPLATRTFDSDQLRTTGTDFIRFSWTTSVELAAGTQYRLVYKPTSASNIVIEHIDVNSAAILDQMGGKQACHHTQRTDAGAWSETTTRRTMIGLQIDAVDDGAGTGGTTIAGTPMRRGMV